MTDPIYADGKQVQIHPEDARRIWKLAIQAHQGNAEALHYLRRELSTLAPQWQAERKTNDP